MTGLYITNRGDFVTYGRTTLGTIGQGTRGVFSVYVYVIILHVKDTIYGGRFGVTMGQDLVVGNGLGCVHKRGGVFNTLFGNGIGVLLYNFN